MEIDLLIHSNGCYYPVEIKAKSTPDIHDCKWIRALQKTSIPTGTASVIAMPQSVYNLAPDIVVQSVWDI